MALARLRRPALILAICFAGSFAFAFFFDAVLQRSLPLTDEGYQLRGLALFADPFVLYGSILCATVAALIAFPIALHCLKSRKLLTCSVFVGGIVLAEIMLVTPFWGWPGLFGSFQALIAALLFCKFTKTTMFIEPSTKT